jgi:site-specific DNA-methyltransferase (adenine-specific)
MQKENKLYLGDCLNVLPQFETDSIDAIITDPPYGLKFMNNKWDASVPSVEIWQECLRILKPGAFAFVMSSPRQDVLSRMIINISDAGFDTNFTSIYWAYNTGFPKAQNISKVLDKRAGAKQNSQKVFDIDRKKFQAEGRPIKAPVTEEAKKFDGAYSGFPPKPAVEVVIVAMKPLNENTYVDQALKNGHGCTWLDHCRMPYANEAEIGRIEAKMSKHAVVGKDMFNGHLKKSAWQFDKKIGRFPTNIICENDSMDGSLEGEHYSRYFSLEAWFEKYISRLPQKTQNTFPFLITPKPSEFEKQKHIRINAIDNSDIYNGKFPNSKADKENKNKHPTIKPLKLMMWLIILGTQEGDIVLDPFMGSGTTPLAAKMTHRHYKGIELEKEFFDISVKRIDEAQRNMDTFL